MDQTNHRNEYHTSENTQIYNQSWTFLYGQFINSVNSTIRSLFIINSGAILSLLTFVGHQHNSSLFQKLKISFVLLIIGTIFAFFCSLLEMVRQGAEINIHKKTWENLGQQIENNTPPIRLIRWHEYTRFGAWICGIISFACFASGVFLSICKLST